MPTPHAPNQTLAHGVAMPLVGFGTWQARGSDAYDAVRLALDVGYRHLDTATMYRNEREVGRAVRDSGVSRDELFVTTKVAPSDAARAGKVIQESLRALEFDHVDLWLIHWPPQRSASPSTWQQLLEARESGLAREVGVSNYSISQIDELDQATGELPAVNQIEWGPTRFDADELAQHQQRGVVLEGYSPFKSTDMHHKSLGSVADVHGKTPYQIVVRWHLQHGTPVIPKSINHDRIASNFEVFDFELTDEEMAAVDRLGA